MSEEKTFTPLYEMTERGLYYNDPKTEQAMRLCSPFEFVAQFHDRYGDNLGLILKSHDNVGRPHQTALLMEDMADSGKVLRELYRAGMKVSTNWFQREKLLEYLIVESAKVKTYFHVATQTGWYDNVYVMPGEVLGEHSDSNGVVLMNNHVSAEDYAQQGALEEWQKHVANYCPGNSRLVMAAQIGLASILLNFTSDESGGYQFTGKSSIGKTSAAYVAASIYGSPRFIKQWRLTVNGLEGVAASRNHALLILDELSQVDSRSAGEAAYLLGNGQGKQRANRYGYNRPTQRWRLHFLSTGEISLSQHMLSGRTHATAGQENRMVDIPADTDVYGIFEYLHDVPRPAELAELLRLNTQQYYGTASRAFIGKVQENLDSIANRIVELRREFIQNLSLPDDADGQVRRVAERFSLAYAAGVLGIEFGILPWPEAEPMKSTLKCFRAWLEQRGDTGSLEDKQIIEFVKGFFEANGSSPKFVQIIQSENRDAEIPKVSNQYGYKEYVQGKVFYYLLPSVFQNRLCKRYSRDAVIDVCIRHGLLITNIKGRNTVQKWVPIFDKNMRLYKFTDKVFGDEE